MTGGRLTPMLIAGTLPGVIAGSFIRGELFTRAHTGPSRTNSLGRPVAPIPAPVLVVLAGRLGHRHRGLLPVFRCWGYRWAGECAWREALALMRCKGAVTARGYPSLHGHG
jgi:hypothetical protein